MGGSMYIDTGKPEKSQPKNLDSIHAPDEHTRSGWNKTIEFLQAQPYIKH